MATLTELYQQHRGKVSDKWQSYLPYYERLFAPYRQQPVRLLEIGVQNGGSLEVWAAYFKNATTLIGCDINERCAALRFDDPRIRVVIGDAGLAATAERLAAEAESFDIVIEDGSHVSQDIVKAFARYFPRLAEGGVFVAEDLHASYWLNYQGGLHHQRSSISFFKLLVDVVNHEHWGIAAEAKSLLAAYCRDLEVDFEAELLAQIASVEFVNSICVVRKQAAADNRLGVRVIAGSEAAVDPTILPAGGTALPGADESQNPHARPPEQGAPMLVRLARRLDRRLGPLKAVYGRMRHLMR
jgi:O-antigen biosynthesis protein